MSLNEIHLEAHPLLELAAFTTCFPSPLGQTPSPAWLQEFLGPQAEAPIPSPDDEFRNAVRRMLRHGGFKPSGRSKPASEYLVRAANSGDLGSINAAVDACNAVSLHSGIPVSVVDLDRASPPFRVAVVGPGQSYVFNASGQEMDLEGLVCLWDASGPCANAVKDSQRTKTHQGTLRTLSILWGSNQVPGRARQAADWYRTLLESLEATTHAVGISAASSPVS